MNLKNERRDRGGGGGQKERERGPDIPIARSVSLIISLRFCGEGAILFVDFSMERIYLRLQAKRQAKQISIGINFSFIRVFVGQCYEVKFVCVSSFV